LEEDLEYSGREDKRLIKKLQIELEAKQNHFDSMVKEFEAKI